MLRVLVGLLAFAALATGAKKPVTVDVITRASPVEAISNPAWSPDGSSIAFTAGKAAWIYEVRGKQRRKLGSLEPLERAAVKPPAGLPFEWENRRVRTEAIQWTPDGRSLVLFVEGDLFLWPIGGAKWDQLTATPEPETNAKLSPDGQMISFERGRELHVLDLATRQTRQVTQGSTATVWNGRLDWVYPEELDLGTAHWWSPDSKYIAYLQFDVSRQRIYPHANLRDVEAVYEPQRYPKAGTPNADVRLGVVPANGGATKWMDLGDPRNRLLARVDWLPDSKRIAVQRLNRVQNELALLFAEASTGAARTVLTERSPHWVNVSSDLRFFRHRDAFLWSSERSGFRHLYEIGYDGEVIRQLTEGPWEVKSVEGLDEGRGMVYYHSRERGPLGVDLASVDTRTGVRKVISRAKGSHMVDLSPTFEHYIDSFTSLTEPARKTIHRISGDELDVLQPPNPVTNELDILRPEIVEVKADDGAILYARLLRPAKFDKKKKYPAIVQVYGGPHAQGVCECYGGLSLEQVWAHRGFVVWQLDNRGTTGRGLEWETKLFRRLGKQELDDQRAGIRHLVGLGFVDAKRIGMYGWSYGGFMTLYTALNAPELLRAAVAGAPVTDWRNYDTIYTERYLGLPQENEEGYRASSPVHQAANLKAALLLLHNYGDDNVLFQQSFQMMAALEEAGKPFASVVYPQRTHGVTGQLKKHLAETITAFFERELKEE